MFFLYFIYFFVYRLSAKKKKTDRSIHEHYITSYIRAIFYINCDYNFNPCGIFEKMMSFSQILNQDFEQGKLLLIVIIISTRVVFLRK